MSDNPDSQTPKLDQAAYYLRESFALVNSALKSGEITREDWSDYLNTIPMSFFNDKVAGGFDAACSRQIEFIFRS